MIDAGVRKSYLRAENRRSRDEKATPDCRWGDCMHCGIPGNGLDTDLAAATLPAVGEAAPEQARAANAAYRLRPAPRVVPPPPPLEQPERTARARFTFAKTGDARWLSHRNVMDLFERALRAAAVPVRFTEGFNPHIRISMGPALPLGAEALGEMFEVDLYAPIEAGALSRTNRVLPPGLELTGLVTLPCDSPSLGKQIATARVRIRRCARVPAWPEHPPEVAGLLDWRIDGDDLVVTVNARQVDGPTPSARDILTALGVAAEVLPRVPVVREALVAALKVGQAAVAMHRPCCGADSLRSEQGNHRRLR